MTWIPNQTQNKHLMKYDIECNLHVEYITKKADKNSRIQMYFKVLNPGCLDVVKEDVGDRMLDLDDVILPFWQTDENNVICKIFDNGKYEFEKRQQYKMEINVKYWRLKNDIQGYSFFINKLIKINI